MQDPTDDFYLHVVSFDIPYPPDYGGIVDVYYKLRALHVAGVKIILHCFMYSGHNQPTDELNNCCERVYYYHRPKQWFKLVFGRLPYTVSSRASKELVKNLAADRYPILFEGLHTCYLLDHPLLKGRRKYVRVHNIEHEYYKQLAGSERNVLKRQYLAREAYRLKRFEKILVHADVIFAIAKMDVPHFSNYSPTVHVPAFFKNDHERYEVNKSGVQGPYILFHGNLSVRDNERAAAFILGQIAPLAGYRIVIAGKSPSQWLKNEVSVTENALLFDSPTIIRMDALVQHAQINLLLTFQQTGIKLKLLHALESGKHVIINSLMDDDGIFSELCHVKNTPEEMVSAIHDLMKREWTEKDSQVRRERFAAYFENAKNAQRIMKLIKPVGANVS